MPVQCPNCGIDNLDASLYCKSCGKLLEPFELPEQQAPVEEIEELGVLAGRSSRLAAGVVDALIVVFPYSALFFGSLPQLVFYLATGYLVAVVLVQTALLTTAGQTLGKRALKIRIVKWETGVNGGFVPNVLLRTILNNLIVIIFFPYQLIDILFIFRGDRRCIHDLIAGTVVVKA